MKSWCTPTCVPAPQAETNCAGGKKIKQERESWSLEASQAACKDTAADRRLDSENSENNRGIVLGPSRQSPCIY